MAILVTSFASRLVFLISPVITVIACGMYFRSVHSRASLMMLVGAAGGLLMGAISVAVGMEFQRRALSGISAAAMGELSTQQLYFSIATSAVGFCFALMFSISLFLALRDAAHTYGNTMRAAQPQSSAAGPA